MLIVTLMSSQFSLAYTCACAYAYAYVLVKTRLKGFEHWSLNSESFSAKEN